VLIAENEETSEPKNTYQDADISDVLDNTVVIDPLMYDVDENNDVELRDSDSRRVMRGAPFSDISDSECDLHVPLLPFDDVIPSGNVGSDTDSESDGTCDETFRNDVCKN